MDLRSIGLLSTLLLVVFILMFGLVSFMLDRKEKNRDLIISLLFIVLILSSIAIVLPEVIGYLKIGYIWLFIIFTILGIFMFKFIDSLLSNHYNVKMIKKDLKIANVYHMGKLLYIFIFLFDLFFGLISYSKTGNKVQTGLYLTLNYAFFVGVINFGVIALFYQSNKISTKKCFLDILFLIISTLVGGFVGYLFSILVINRFFAGIVLSLFIGGAIYIAFGEFFRTILKTKFRKESIIGLVIGTLIVVISFIFTLL